MARKPVLVPVTESKHKSVRQPAIAALLNVTVTYDSYFTRALADVTFGVRQGEIFALLGPKGSGKSSALKVLAGRLRPADGKVAVFGRSPRRKAIQARIGFLPQIDREKNSTGFHRLLKRILAPFRGVTMPPRNIAQMLLKNPDLLILDEPFSGLDEKGCREMKDLIARFAAQGKTVIVSDESFSNVKTICDHVAICHGGKIEVTGTLDEILASPDLLRSVATLLSSETAERVLEVIRNDLGKAAMSRNDKPSDPARREQAGAKPGSATAADQLLAPLAKAPVLPPSTDLPAAPIDHVNYEKLDGLTKPKAGASS